MTTAVDSELQALPANLVELLLELAIGLHRYAIYPSDHPSVVSLGERLARRINTYTAREGAIHVGVADGRLVVGEGATDPAQPILRDLARKARDRHVGGFVLLPQMASVDIELFLQGMSEEAEDGMMPKVETERIRLLPPGYDRLQLADPDLLGGDPGSRAHDLWLGLARSAISNGAIQQEDASDISGLAASVRQRLGEDGGGRVILGYMAQIAGVLAEDPEAGEGGSLGNLRSQFRALIDALDPATLRELMQREGGNDANIRLAFDVCRSLDPTTAVKVLEAVPKREGRRISHQLVRLLRKMSAREGQVPAEKQRHAVDTFRDAIERLSDDWQAGDREASRRHADAGDLHVLSDAENPSALSMEKRILLISLELGVVGAALQAAVRAMTETEEILALKKLAEARSSGHPVVDYVRETLHSSDNIARRIRDEATDPKLLEALVDGAGLSAVEPLLDALIESPSRAVRRTAFDLLKKLGMPAGLAAVTRLENQPWYVLRNLLVLSQSLETVPAGVDPLPLLFHEDARVRKEAFPVCVKASDGRTPSLKAGLADEDERIVMMALREAKEDLPGMLVPEVAQHVERGGDLANQAILALKESDSPLALKSLLDVCQGRGLLGGVRLSRKSPALLLALEALAERWSEVDEVQAVLEVASASKDAEVRAAAGGSEG
ncbi:MAG: hypothetical protein HKO53_05950 [Gemmatimonadetes bacterium]|nr:hypothetical protein [Gemmatimonadota bacterium]